METIFSYKPTEKELEKIFYSYKYISKDDYLEMIKNRVSVNQSNIEYETLIDLQELFFIRKNKDKVNQYTHIIDTKFSALKEKLFNE